MLALAVRRIEPEALAGDRFSEANAAGSIWVALPGVTDSLELHDDDVGTDADGGSSFSEILRIL